MIRFRVTPEKHAFQQSRARQGVLRICSAYKASCQLPDHRHSLNGCSSEHFAPRFIKQLNNNLLPELLLHYYLSYMRELPLLIIVVAD